MNKKLNINNLKKHEVITGFHGRFINSENITLAFWEIEKDSSIPRHSHIHEQIMHVLNGSFEFTINGFTSTFSDGDIIVIPPNTSHSGTALTNCKIMDVFSPKREEYQ